MEENEPEQKTKEQRQGFPLDFFLTMKKGCGDFGQLGQGKVKLRSHDYEPPGKVVLDDPVHFVAIAPGQNHCTALSSEGHVYSWGHGELGRLGLGGTYPDWKTPTRVDTPQRIPDFENIVAISCGQSHSLALNKEGKVFAWGRGDLGALGSNDTKPKDSPQLIEDLSYLTVIAIACGSDFSLALTDEHKVYGWGLNQRKPTLIQGIDDVVSIACTGNNQRYLLKRDGTVWKGRGTLKKVEALKDVVAIAVGGLECLALTATGDVYNWGDRITDVGKQIIVPMTKVAKNGIFISCNAYHSLIINDSNEVLSFGVETYGRLGRPETGAGTEKNREPKVVELPKGNRWHFNSHFNHPYENWIFFLTVKWCKIR